MRSRKRQAGAEILEFVVTLPVILIFLFLIIEFGIALTDQAVLADVSRAAARAAIGAESLPCFDSSGKAKSTCDCGETGNPMQDPVWCAAHEAFAAKETSYNDASSFIWWNRSAQPNPVITVTRSGTNPGSLVTATAAYPFFFRLFPALEKLIPGFDVPDSLNLSATTRMRMVPY